MAGVPGAEVAAILRAQPWPQNWTPLEVRRWLEAIALEAYAPTFEAAGVQGADLIGMDADALKRRLGVAHLGHRTKLLKEIAILSNRAMLSMRRGEDGKAKDFAQKRKELKDIVYPDRVRRELKAQQDEKLLEARAGFWTPAAARRCQKSTMGNQGKAWSAAQNCKQPNDDLLITKGVATANLRVGDDQHRTQTWGADPAQQRALVRPSTGRRQRGQRGVRPQTAGTRQVEDRAEATGGWQDGSGEEAGETEVFIKPTDKIVQVVEKIKQYEAEANYDKLIKAWVEYGACVRIEYSDKDRLLVRTHFNLATTYLRQKLTAQALYHFKEADLLNQENAHTEDALFFKCRIMEGMGICETRLGHFKAADTLLEQARRVCLRKVLGKDSIDENALTELPEDEEINDSDGTVASVWVAKSELYSAQAEYDKAEKSLLLAYSLKERQLGDKDTQIGKLCSALGTICQKKMRHKEDLLLDVQVTLESAIRIRQEIQDKTEGIALKGLEQEKGLEQLLRDIANMQDKERRLQENVRVCKADMLDYYNRARNICAHNLDEDNEETVKMTKLVANLATKFAKEESARTGHNILSFRGEEASDPVSPTENDAIKQTQAWFAKQGIDTNEWGLGPDSATTPNPSGPPEIEFIISSLRQK